MDSKYKENSEEIDCHQESVDIRLPDEIVAYRVAQRAMVDLKTAVYFMISLGPQEGYSNAEIGRKLGIYAGHVGHEGHIFLQDSESKKWLIKK